MAQDNLKDITWWQVTFALIRSMVGLSAFTIAYVFARWGPGWGSLLILCSGIISFFPLYGLFLCADEKDKFSFQGLIAENTDRKHLFALNIMVFAVQLSSLIKGIIYSVTFLGLFIDLQQWALGLCVTAVLLILTFAKNNSVIFGESLLNLFNYLNVLILLYFVSTAISQKIELPSPNLSPFKFAGTLTSFSSAILAYSAETNLLDILSKVNNKERPKIVWSIISALFLTCAFYLVVGNLAYYTFGSKFPDTNLLIAYGYPRNSHGEFVFSGVVSACIWAVLVLIFVYLHFALKPLKDVVEWIVSLGKKSDLAKGSERFLYYCIAISIAYGLFIPTGVGKVVTYVKAILEPAVKFAFAIILYQRVKLKGIRFYCVYFIFVLLYLALVSFNFFCIARPDLGVCSS